MFSRLSFTCHDTVLQRLRLSAERFGDLRGLLQQRAGVGEWYWPGRDWYKAQQSEAWWLKEEAWREQVCHLLIHLYRSEPTYYEEVCLPYLNQFPQLWRYPLAERWLNLHVERGRWSEELEHIAPAEAKFALHAVSNALNGSMFRDAAKSRTLGAMIQSITCANFSDHAVMPQGAENLAELDALTRLEQLILQGCHIGSDGLLALGASMRLQRLEVLDVSSCQIDDGGVEDFVDRFQIKRLRALGLAHNALTERALEVLICSPALEALEALDVRGNRFGENVAQLIDMWSAQRGGELRVRLR